jgi:hypothetical protein
VPIITNQILDVEEFVMSGNDKAVQLDERFDAGEPVPTDQLVMNRDDFDSDEAMKPWSTILRITLKPLVKLTMRIKKKYQRVINKK